MRALTSSVARPFPPRRCRASTRLPGHGDDGPTLEIYTFAPTEGRAGARSTAPGGPHRVRGRRRRQRSPPRPRHRRNRDRRGRDTHDRGRTARHLVLRERPRGQRRRAPELGAAGVSQRFDVVIENGTIVDGSGTLSFRASIGIRDGRIEVMHDPVDDVEATRRIDASAKVVAPGFIDLHSHSGLMIFADPLHEPKVRQGVTTEVIGVDGSPMRRSRPGRPRGPGPYERGLDGAPEEALPTTGRASSVISSASLRPPVRQPRAPHWEQRAADRGDRLG